jgi:phosphoglycerate kinase
METMICYLREANTKVLGGTALLRLDFNTEDDWRMQAALPTIKFLLKTSARVVILSHRGRPDGVDSKFSLKKNTKTLEKLLGRKGIVFIPAPEAFDFVKLREKIKLSPRGTIFLLENLRFNPGEEKNDSKFASGLASLGDFYVNDAFAVSHRENASITAITKFLPSYAGFGLENEIISLSKVMQAPKRPLVFIVGGAKAADKLDVIKYFAKRADCFLLGGGPANTILYLNGMDIKKSLRDTDLKDVKEIQRFSRSKKVVMPVDFRWHGEYIWDIGPKSEKIFAAKLSSAGTILWSGPLGFIEKPAFARGSLVAARAIGRNRNAFSVAGGGETVMFLKKYKLDKKFSFISTGGGAMIEFLAGKKLPGIVALMRAGGKKGAGR